MRQDLASRIPVLPDQRKQQYQSQYGLSPLTAEVLVTRKDIADYFETAAADTRYPLLCANLVAGEVARLTPEDQAVPIAPSHLAALSDMLGDGKINAGTCKKVIGQLMTEDQDPSALIEAQGLQQISDETVLLPMARTVMDQNQKAVADYRSGNTNAFHALVGQMMKQTQGKGNPQVIQRLLKGLLEDT